MTTAPLPPESDSVHWLRLFADEPAACAAAQTYPAKLRAAADELERERSGAVKTELKRRNAELESELARLRAEIAEAKTAAQRHFDEWAATSAKVIEQDDEIDEIEAERDAARAEVERLRESQNLMYGSGKRLEGELRHRAQNVEAKLATATAERDAAVALVDEIWHAFAFGPRENIRRLPTEDWLARAKALRAIKETSKT